MKRKKGLTFLAELKPLCVHPLPKSFVVVTPWALADAAYLITTPQSDFDNRRFAPNVEARWERAEP